MAHGIAGPADADRRVLGRDAGAPVPGIAHLDDGNAGSWYSLGLVVQLWRPSCPCSGTTYLRNAAVAGERRSIMGGVHSLLDPCTRTTMVRELLGSSQALCCNCRGGRSRTIRYRYRRGVVAGKCARRAVERVDCEPAQRLSRHAYLRYELDLTAATASYL